MLLNNKIWVLYISLAILLCVNACNGTRTIDKLSEKERYSLLGLFRHKTITRGGERETFRIFVKIYQNDTLFNDYHFIESKDSFNLVYSKLNYLDSIYQINSVSLRPLILKMDSLNIKSISSDMAVWGIDLKIYLMDGQTRLYVENPKKLSPYILSYFLKMKKISNNWYQSNE